MSCEICALYKSGFETEKQFTDMQIILNNLVKDNQFTMLGLKENSRFFAIEYKCCQCNSIWTLSIPDQAYRGGWYEK